MQTEGLVKSLEALFYVYFQLDPAGILTASFPNKNTFYEEKIETINYSFLKFLDSHPDLADTDKTNVREKFKNQLYTSVYDIFHDIKLACIIKILEYEDNPELYVKVDQFYKVSIELLLREATRLRLALKNKGADTQPKADNQSESKDKPQSESDVQEISHLQSQLQLKPIESTAALESALEQDFQIISSTFYNSMGKSLSIFMPGNVPFFSSLNNVKSDLDDREPIIDPSLGITLTNVIPNVSDISDDKLSKFSNNDVKVPNIKQILENYMHPNWLRLISSQWLKHGNNLSSLYFSFAPTYDETQSIISNDWKGLTWCQQIGFDKLVKAKEKYNVSLHSQDKDNAIKLDEPGDKFVDTRESSVEKKDEEKEDELEEQNDAGKDLDEQDDEDNKEKIDLANLLQWNPNNLVTEEEVQAVESNTVQVKVSDLLNQLSELRQNRIERQKKHARYNKTILGTGSRIFKPSNDEVKLYFKIKRMLTGLIEAKNINPNQLNIDIDKRIPVLQHNYQGTLPASFGVSNQKSTKSKRKR